MPDEIVPQCEAATIRFPSDAITLGAMRRAQPDLFSVGGMLNGAVADSDALSVLRREIKLAEKAFAAALWLSDPFPAEMDHRDELIKDLSEAYSAYGISTGPQASLELIKGIEAEAVAQSKKWSGRMR